MKALTKEGQKTIDDIARRFELKTQSVEAMVKAVINGNGTMAQFNIPELGGNGQWMKGGMTMVGDMFNNSLKFTVDKLCTELSDLVSTKVIFEEPVEAMHSQFSGSGHSWPSVFGSPTASGSQNNFKYAYFAPVRRLVIEQDGKRNIYDTKHHHITGVSQQQGSGQSFLLTSQEGPVDISTLSLISEPGDQTQPTPQLVYDVVSNSGKTAEVKSPGEQDIIFSTIERISGLFEKGHITEEEFKAKKQELLARL